MSFKVGDKVKCVGSCISPLWVGKIYTVRAVSKAGCFIAVNGVRSSWSADRFEKVEPNLETEIRLCESRKEILDGRICKDQEEKKSLEKRIQELQQAIKERDKPKGRVKTGDALTYPLWLICASGQVAEHNGSCWTQDHISVGNLFYDKESAERAVHDRKQRVLRGEDV